MVRPIVSHVFGFFKAEKMTGRRGERGSDPEPPDAEKFIRNNVNRILVEGKCMGVLYLVSGSSYP